MVNLTHFQREVGRAADTVAPAYKTAVLTALPIAVPIALASIGGVPAFLTPIAVAGLEAGVAALPAREVLAIGLAYPTSGASLFLFALPKAEGKDG